MRGFRGEVSVLAERVGSLRWLDDTTRTWRAEHKTVSLVVYPHSLANSYRRYIHDCGGM